jgi:hypothetical protein
MRRLTAGLLALSVLTASCSDQKANQLTAPFTGAHAVAVQGAGNTDSAAAAEDLIQQLFGAPDGSCSGNCNAALTRFQQIEELYSVPPPYDMDAVVSHTYDLIGYVIAKWDAGTLNDPPGKPGVIHLLNLLLYYAGIDSGVCQLSTDCDFTLYQPGSPAQILTTPLGLAGVKLPPGDGTVTAPTLISVSSIDNPSVPPLKTQLDQYPYFYLYTSSSGQGMSPDNPFLTPVTVEVCLQPPLPPSGVLARLALAHNVPEPPPYLNIQILPSAASFLPSGCSGSASNGTSLYGNLAMRTWRFLTAELSAVLAPAPLQASVLAAATGTGTVGSTKTFSPFGAVDTIANIAAASSTTGIWRVQGGTVSGTDAPKVRVLTPNGNPMKQIEVTFTVTAGGGTVSGGTGSGSSTTVLTDNNGYATLPSWTLGASINTVQATGKVTPCGAPVAAGTEVDCGTVMGSVTFTAEAASAIVPASPLNQTVAAGSPVPVPPAVKIVDAANNGVAGVPVRFDAQGTGTITANGNSTPVASAVVLSNASGIAALDGWVLDPGANTLTATAVDPANSAVALALSGNPVTFTGTGTTTTTEVFCPPTNGAGDQVSHGLVYTAVKKGTRLSKVALYLATNNPANFPNPFTFRVDVFQDGYNGALLGSASTPQGLKGSTSENKRTVFTFTNFTAVNPGTGKTADLYFRITAPVNPSNATAYFAVSNCAPGAKNCKTTNACGSFAETVDNTTSPYVLYRKGLGIDVYQTP